MKPEIAVQMLNLRKVEVICRVMEAPIERGRNWNGHNVTPHDHCHRASPNCANFRRVVLQTPHTPPIIASAPSPHISLSRSPHLTEKHKDLLSRISFVITMDSSERFLVENLGTLARIGCQKTLARQQN